MTIIKYKIVITSHPWTVPLLSGKSWVNSAENKELPDFVAFSFCICDNNDDNSSKISSLGRLPSIYIYRIVKYRWNLYERKKRRLEINATEDTYMHTYDKHTHN